MEEVKIGTQIWMNCNLDVETFRNGDPIPHAKTEEEWLQAGENNQPAWCYYDNDQNNGEKYGKLYNWYAVIDPRGLALVGWHVPTDEDWTLLSDFLGGGYIAGEKLKTVSGWENNGNGTDEVGFAGAPGGSRGFSGNFDDIGSYGNWWSSSESIISSSAWYYYLNNESGSFDRYDYDKTGGFSVRCLRD
jgi:uncharacterized protein (TIGR02145 family)